MCRATAADYDRSLKLFSDKGYRAQRTCTDVVPVWVVRCELLERPGFNNVDPCWDLKLSRPLEMGSICGNESIGAASDIHD